MAVKGEAIEADDRKYGQDSYCYEGFTSKNVSGMNISTDLYSKSTTLGATFIKPSGTQGDSLKKDIRGLLENAGFVGIEFSDYGNQSFSVSVPQVEGKGMIEMVKALSSTVDIDRDTAYYAVLNAQDAQDVMMEEAKERLKISLQQAGLMSVSMQTMDNTGGQRYGVGVAAPTYKDVNFGGIGAIESMREDGFASKFAVEKHTSITASEGMGKIVQEKLEAAGFDVHRQDGSPHMSVSAKPNGADANIDNISNALAGANLIPAMAAQEIKAVQPVAPAAIAPVAPAATQAIKMNATR